MSLITDLQRASDVTRRSRAMIAAAIGFSALGGVAIGALAIRRLAIRSVVLGDVKVKSLHIQDLTVARVQVVDLAVSGSLQLPADQIHRPSAGTDPSTR